MSANKTSPIKRTYLITLSPPQGIVQTAMQLMAEFRRRGLLTSPIPPAVPILEIIKEPKPPVAGLLPVCTEALEAMKFLSLSEGGWVYWPVESEGWFEKLAAALSQGNTQGKNESQPNSQTPLYPNCPGLPLARFEGSSSEAGFMSQEIINILKTNHGWRALNLSCWYIEYLAHRPWYKSTMWYPIWQRRLKRAPVSTNKNKQSKLA